MTRTAFIKLIKISTAIVAIMLVTAFVIWRSSNYVKGPSISVTEPANGSLIKERSATLKGQVLRTKSLLLNGSEINIDEQGNFSEVVVIFPGVNMITLTAKDQFGRSVEDRLTLVGSISSTSPSFLGE